MVCCLHSELIEVLHFIQKLVQTRWNCLPLQVHRPHDKEPCSSMPCLAYLLVSVLLEVMALASYCPATSLSPWPPVQPDMPSDFHVIYASPSSRHTCLCNPGVWWQNQPSLVGLLTKAGQIFKATACTKTMGNACWDPDFCTGMSIWVPGYGAGPRFLYFKELPECFWSRCFLNKMVLLWRSKPFPAWKLFYSIFWAGN